MGPDREECITINTHHTTVLNLRRNHGQEARPLRYMRKDGRFRVDFKKSPGDWSPYVVDIFTTLVELRWRAMLLIFSLSYILSWLFFGLLYWLIAYAHGDTADPDNEPCIYNVRDFTAAFLFSMETQATIGYGFRGMSEECMEAIIVVTIHDVFSCFIDTFVIGIAVAKMASARKRAQTVGFSRAALVNLRDGALCLSWRLGDFRGNHILEGDVQAQVIRHVRHPSGTIKLFHQDLDIQDRNIILATPSTIIHKLEPGSPLYSLSPDTLLEEDFELVVSFTYTGDSTGMLHQTRASYSPGDIRWGQRFKEMLKPGRRHYKVDYALFNQTTWVEVPALSAEEYDRGRTAVEGVQSPLLASVKRSIHRRQNGPDVTEDILQEAWL